MSLWGRFTSLFVPRGQPLARSRRREVDPDGPRQDRPLPTYSRTRWYQDDLEAAILQADGGNLALAAQLCAAFSRDGTIAGLGSTRTGGLTRLPKRFRGTESVIAELANTAEVGLGRFDRIFPPGELAQFMLDRIFLGIAVGELLWPPDRCEPVFVRLDPQFLVYKWYEDRWYYRAEGGEILITPGDGRWILFASSYIAPWRHGLWPSLGRAFISKDHAFHYRESYSGSLAHPARVGTHPAGASDGQADKLLSDLENWGPNASFIAPPGYGVELVESNGRGYEVFAQTIATCDTEFQLSLAGQTVTTSGGSGFFNAQIHATIRGDLIQQDAHQLAYTINSQGLAPIINILYGGDAQVAIAWDTTPPKDLKGDADAMTAMIAVIENAQRVLAGDGFKIDVREMATRYQVPLLPIDGGAPALPAGDTTPALESETMDAEFEVSVDDEGIVEPSAAEALAAKMTAHEVERCDHGHSNRCPRCGVERLRDFELGPSGEVEWGVAWRAIAPEVDA